MNELLGYDDITLIPKHSSLTGRGDCDTSVTILDDKYDMPLAIAPMTVITTPEMIYACYINHLLPTLHRYFNNADEQYDYIYLGLGNVLSRNDEDKLNHFAFNHNAVDYPNFDNQIKEIIDTVYFAVGGIKKYKNWIDTLIEKGIHRFCVDMAHGDIDECIKTCLYIKEHNENIKIIAGNYATHSGIPLNPFADIYRVGISCGACCTTARNTGFGMPTYSSLLDCRHRKDREIIMADGGIKVNGDIVKAMSADADIVMIGFLLAGSSAAGGKMFDENIIPCNDSGKTCFYKQYMGMASSTAKSIIGLGGSVEGVSGLVKYTGNTQDVINNIKENLKSALAYCGAKNWEEFSQRVETKRVSVNGSIEGKSRLL